MRIAAVAACLFAAGGLAAQAAESGKASDRIQMAQMNSPGDGLDSDSAADGNGRQRKAGAPMARKKTMRKGKRRM